MLSSFLSMPRVGHLEAAINIMGYLRLHHNYQMLLDPTYPVLDHSYFNDGAEWAGLYGDATEAIPLNMPAPRGKDIDLRLLCDSDHTGKKYTHLSRTGYLIFKNMALIVWLSKKQPTFESSVFGAEFAAMKSGMEHLRGLRYKLCMMGVPLAGPSYIYGDNMSVIHNTQRPESTLKNKNNSICYHALREAVAMGECFTTHIPTKENLSDMMPKVLYGSKKRGLVKGLMYDCF